jgi:Thioesterase-like superfamily
VAGDPIDEFQHLFARDGERFVPTELARGPWNPNAMHGGAPSALLAYVLARHDPGPAEFVARLTVELMRPVPLAPLQAVARTVRPGRNVQWVEGALIADGTEVVRAAALRLRLQSVDVDDAVSPAIVAPPPPEAGSAPSFEFFDRDAIGYWAANEIRLVQGAIGVAGPATAWLRLRCPVVDDNVPSPFERVAAAADFGSGIGNPLTFVTARAINPEITIHVHRHPDTEWLCLESGAWAETHGVGMAETRLHDVRGPLGRSVQTLLVSPIESNGRPQFAR